MRVRARLAACLLTLADVRGRHVGQHVAVALLAFDLLPPD